MSFVVSLVWALSYLTLLLAVAYKYFTWNFSYFLEQGISGPRPIPVFGNCWKIWKQSWARLEVTRYQKYGKIYGTFEGRTPNLVVGDARLISKILRDDFRNFENRRKVKVHPSLRSCLAPLQGQKWREIRTQTEPIFTVEKIQELLHLIEPGAQDMVNFLDNEVRGGLKKVDLRKLATIYAVQGVARYAFGTTLNAFMNPGDEFCSELNTIFGRDHSTSPANVIRAIYPILDKFLPRPDSFQFFASLAKDLLKSRRLERRTNSSRKDFIDLFMEDTPLDDDAIVGQLVQFLVTGIEPVAVAIACGINSLALNPDVQQALKESLTSPNPDGDHSGKDVTAHLDQVTYLDQCVDETLRMFPPAMRLERRCNRSIDYARAKFCRGSLVSIPIYAIHHDPAIYPEPDIFNPQRFSQEERSKRNPNTFLPFGDGNRSCIGEALARLQIKLAMAHLIKNFTFHRVFETSEPPNFSPSGFPPMLNPKPIIVGIKK